MFLIQFYFVTFKLVKSLRSFMAGVQDSCTGLM